MPEKKIITLLSGGMGNQMHQYAYGLYLSDKINAKLYIDISFYSIKPSTINITGRNFMLHVFGIFNCINSIYSNRWLIRIVKHFKLFEMLMRKIFKVQYVFTKDQVIKSDCLKIILVFIFGSLNEYNVIKNQVIDSFKLGDKYTLKANILINKLKLDNKILVVIHIRRTDYLAKNSLHWVLEKSYYENSIEFIRQRISNPIFYFIGDDKEWINDNFDFKLNKEFITSYDKRDNMLFDFAMITLCDHIIASNSTFSWWGCFLNTQKNKMVIVPKNWLKIDLDNLANRYPAGWTVID